VELDNVRSRSWGSYGGPQRPQTDAGQRHCGRGPARAHRGTRHHAQPLCQLAVPPCRPADSPRGSSRLRTATQQRAVRIKSAHPTPASANFSANNVELCT
jgi:hypothetical protein